MIDFIVLEQMTAFAVIMQKHPGWVGKYFKAMDMLSVLFACSTFEKMMFSASFLQLTDFLSIDFY